MRTPIEDNLEQWTARITAGSTVRETVKSIAKSEHRSNATMIGVLLAEAIAARSTE